LYFENPRNVSDRAPVPSKPKTPKNTSESGTVPRFSPPGPLRQLGFYQLLVAARKQWLIDALADVLRELDQNQIKKELAQFVPGDVQQILAGAKIRDEYIFPVPLILQAKPSLIGYYRLLLAPQKSFYDGATGMALFKSMEKTGSATAVQIANLPEFCAAMAVPLSELVRQIPNISDRDVRELPLLTFGSQLQGANNTLIGKKAMEDVFLVISEIVAKYTVKKDSNKLGIINSAKRKVLITLSHDPDVRIEEQVEGGVQQTLAIEVKGGTDVSNAHNRAGEAEKSHVKAKRAGYPEFWTIISTKGLNLGKLKAGSPTTNHWFDIAEVLSRSGPGYESFKNRLVKAVGIPAK
jgi:hypothetical protein